MPRGANLGEGVASERLGALVSRHPPNKTNAAHTQRVSRGIQWFARAVMLFAAYLALRDQSWMILLSFGGLGFLIEVGARLMARRSHRASFINVDVYERGIRSERADGVDELPWSDVAHVTVDASLHTSGWGEFAFEVERTDGSPVRVSINPAQCERPFELFERLLEGCGTAVGVRALDAHERGGAVDFGPVEMSGGEVHHDDESHRLDDVDRVALKAGWLTIDALGEPWVRVRAAKVRDVPALIALVGEKASTPSAQDWIWTWGD